MHISEDEQKLYNYIMEEVLWWIEDEDIYNRGLRESLSDETMQEIATEASKFLNVNVDYTDKMDEMTISQLCTYIIATQA
ncbi:hypothetical protein [Paenibacillus sp. O199]|uniref:hypothetical protein n=1 Tax=Paenibacillus sp. O199 TaxID=1643925 RepID=UPI0007BF8AD8|nr:hypothetical protein [Paenibacillus sp. O199]